MTSTLRLAAVYVAFAAMLLRALTPAGWMPDAHAGTPLVICTINGPVKLTTSPDGGPLEKHSGHHTACPYAAMPHLASLAGAATLTLPSEAPVPAQKPMRHAAPLTGARHSPLVARAPPRFA